MKAKIAIPIALISMTLLVSPASAVGGSDGAVNALEEEATDAYQAADCQLDIKRQIVENLLSPQATPQSKSCFEADGSCFISEEVSAKATGEVSAGFLEVKLDVDGSVEVISTITCSGSWDASITHYGGEALRFAETSLATRARTAAAEDLQPSLPRVPTDAGRQATKTCNYVGPVGACGSEFHGSFEVTRQINGRIVTDGEILGCVTPSIANMDAVEYTVKRSSNLFNALSTPDEWCDTLKFQKSSTNL